MRHLVIIALLLFSPQVVFADASDRPPTQLRIPAALAATLPCDWVFQLKTSTQIPNTLYGVCVSSGRRRDRAQSQSKKILQIGLDTPSPTIQTFTLPNTFAPGTWLGWSGDIAEVGPHRYAVPFDMSEDDNDTETLKTGFVIASLETEQLMRYDLPSTVYFIKPTYVGTGTVKNDAGTVITFTKPADIRAIDYLEENASLYLLVRSREKKISEYDVDWMPDLLMRYSLAASAEKPVLKEFRDILPASEMMAIVGRVGRQYVVVWSDPLGMPPSLPVFNALHKFMPVQFPAPIDLATYPSMEWKSFVGAVPRLTPVPLKPVGVLAISNAFFSDDMFEPKLAGAQITIYDVDGDALYLPQPLLLGNDQQSIFVPSATAADAHGNIFIAHYTVPIVRHGMIAPFPKDNPIHIMTPMTALANNPDCDEPQTLEALVTLVKEDGKSIEDVLCPGVIDAMAVAKNALYIARGNALLRMPIQ